jgi:hypothetical protein
MMQGFAALYERSGYFRLLCYCNIMHRMWPGTSSSSRSVCCDKSLVEYSIVFRTLHLCEVWYGRDCSTATHCPFAAVSPLLLQQSDSHFCAACVVYCTSAASKGQCGKVFGSGNVYRQIYLVALIEVSSPVS